MLVGSRHRAIDQLLASCPDVVLFGGGEWAALDEDRGFGRKQQEQQQGNQLRTADDDVSAQVRRGDHLKKFILPLEVAEGADVRQVNANRNWFSFRTVPRAK